MHHDRSHQIPRNPLMATHGWAGNFTWGCCRFKKVPCNLHMPHCQDPCSDVAGRASQQALRIGSQNFPVYSECQRTSSLPSYNVDPHPLCPVQLSPFWTLGPVEKSLSFLATYPFLSPSAGFSLQLPIMFLTITRAKALALIPTGSSSDLYGSGQQANCFPSISKLVVGNERRDEMILARPSQASHQVGRHARSGDVPNASKKPRWSSLSQDPLWCSLSTPVAIHTLSDTCGSVCSPIWPRSRRASKSI